VRFAIAGTGYEIDLSTKRRRLPSAAPPTSNASAGAGTRARQRPGRTVASRARSTDIRSWAKDHGIALSDRERIPADVAGQYQAAIGGR